MKNKKYITKGIIVATTLTNISTEPLANAISDYNTINPKDKSKENKTENSIKTFFANTVEPIAYLAPELKEINTNSANLSKPTFTKSNISVLEPSLEVNNNTVTIIDGGVMLDSYKEKENSLEEFDNIDDFKYDTLYSIDWTIEDGMLKSKPLYSDSSTEVDFVINAEKGEKLQIKVKSESSGRHYSHIVLGSDKIYQRDGRSDGFEIIEADLYEGQNILNIQYDLGSEWDGGENDAIFIDYIKILKKEVADCETLEYRINGGDWQTYSDTFKLNYPAGTKVQIEARAKYDGFVSSVFSQEVTIESEIIDIEDAIAKAEQSKDVDDINIAREMVNAMPNSPKKDEFQDRLNAIFPNITLEKNIATSNLDVYIKSENMLSISLNTSSVTFDDFSGVSDIEKLNAINLTVNSSLPYKINAYMPTEIQNNDRTNVLDKEILNIRADGQSSYNTFKDTFAPLELLDNQSSGNDVTHGIDLMLKGNMAHVKDVYKTTIKFEVEQK